MAVREATREAVRDQTSTRQSPLDQALVRVYTLDWETIAYIAILVAAILTRFWDLGARVMSHDESLHTYYSWELYDSGRFDHTPLMHGPLLFHATAFFYFLFGPNDFSARIYPAILGVAIVMFPILFRRWLGRAGALFVAAGLLMSPMLLYYSRYIRHDIPSIFFALVMVYALLQYVDGEQARRPVWVAVFGGAMSLLMASKEVAFIYIAIFGSFLSLFWLLRMAQDIQGFGKVKRGATEEDNGITVPEYLITRPALWLLVIGHGLVFVVSVALGFFLGDLFNTFYVTDPGLLPDNISKRVFQAIFIALFFGAFESIGFIRTFIAGGNSEHGTASMFANGLRNPRSALMLVTAGTVLGGVVSLWIASILSIIPPDTIFVDIVMQGQIVDQQIDETALVHFIQWMAIPLGLLALTVVLIGVLKRTPWQDIAVVLLVAILATGVLVFVERHSHPDDEGLLDQPVAIDPTAETEVTTTDYDNTYIYISWMVGGLVVLFVLATRLLTSWWGFLNRQPIFDVLIVMGTLVVPWLAAFPLFWAGYTLDQAPLPPDTIRAAMITSVPFLMISLAVGLAWNWRVWPVAIAAFGGLFLVFFTTFFTNGNGVGTGIIGSLGYWLEQQDVRRGSQPQYYYLLVQLPVYEFLPFLLSGIAGLAGLSWVFEHRQRRVREDKARLASYRQEEIIDESAYAVQSSSGEHVEAVTTSAPHDGELTPSMPVALPLIGSSLDEGSGDGEAVANAEYGGMDSFVSKGWGYRERRLPFWAQPYDHEREMALRRGDNPEYLGGIPFLQLFGYWAVMILVALSIAGEKMPWLTTHLTLPLIFVGGWYVGRVVEKIRWRSIQDYGWVLLLFVLPVFFIALVQMLLPYMTGVDLPFQGRTQAELDATGKWMAAFFAVIITGYFMLKLGVGLGFDQSRRLFITSAVILLGILTMRAAWMFSYINYDYPTEFGVYAHAGPAVKDVLDRLDYLADHSAEGLNIHVVYDDKSSWPMLWYLRDYDNKRYVWGTSDNVADQVGQIEGALVVIVGGNKRSEMDRILGSDYYRFDMIRLWWPMQEYFNLTHERVMNVFEPDSENPAASFYRKGMWDIWWSRDYDRYAQALCIERQTNACYSADQAELPIEERTLDSACVQRIVNECVGDDQFNIERWPVSDDLFMYVRKDFAVQVWDAGLDGQTVSERLIPDPEDQVQSEINAMQSFGSGTLLNPRGLATDETGNLYVADTGNSRIVVFRPDGTVVRQIGEGGLLNQPWGVAVSPADGNVYVADTWNYRVVVFSPEGEFIHSFGQYGIPTDDLPYSMFAPRDIAVDREGNIYVVDTGGHRVRVYNRQWQFVRDIATDGQGLQNDAEPVGIAVHPISGEVYVAETWNQQVSVFNRDGRYLAGWDVNMWAGTRSSAHRPYLTISPDGTLILVSDMNAADGNHGPRVVAYDIRGTAVLAFNAPLVYREENAGNPLGVEVVGGLAFGSDGQVFVADAGTSRIVVFPPLGISGRLAPVPDPTYGDGVAGTVTDSITDQTAVETVGRAYWQALTTGDYELYKSLFCEEDQAQEGFPLGEVMFRSYDASGFMGGDISPLEVYALIQNDTATVEWGGIIIYQPGTAQERQARAEGYSGFPLVKRDNVWLICEYAGETPDVFRPGGG